MSSVEDVIGSIDSNLGDAAELQARLQAVRAEVAGLVGQLQELGADAKASAAQACVQLLETEAAGFLASMEHQLGEARTMMLAVKGG
ncbi:hypothetical protein AB0B28_15980 [Glycomyces sp. NPDC046736]|uniref:hypothetical protein n=1 Tax=Glycomyces sp. NPDC046736 TaxID=3155615 RepID=UPI0033C5CE6F